VSRSRTMAARLGRHMRRWLALPAVAAVMVTTAVFAPTLPAQASGPCFFKGGAWLGVTCWGSPKPLTFFVEEYTVPKNPSVKGKSYITWWGGLEDTNEDAVLQNILAWNENSWSAYPEYYWDGGTSHPHNKNYRSFSARTGDTILSVMQGTDCTNSGHCTWNLTVEDERTGQQSSSGNIRTTSAFPVLFGGVFEPHGVHGCSSLPANGSIAFTHLTVSNILGAQVTPRFGNSTPDRICGMVAESTPTSTHFIWKP
jgi:hypothetical protein